ncbi:MAG: RNA-guided endonuclease TnpB family protein [Candidatus Thorarchaeota archaeon]
MGRSKGTIISVKVPIRWDSMTDRQKTRLNRITGRDSRVIKAFLGVIERHEKSLITGRKRTKIDASQLERLTVTATRGGAKRFHVPHDFKRRFHNISANELQECRDTAIAMWQSYLERGGSKPLQSRGYSSRKIPRYAFSLRFKLVYTPDGKIKYWLNLRDSLDSASERRRIHDRLSIPLSPSSYHLDRVSKGKVKTVRLFKDSHRKWWAIFTVTLDIHPMKSAEHPPAVLSIDLGINKAACSVLLTQRGYKQVRYWKQDEKLRSMKHLDEQIASLQSKKEHLIAAGKNPDSVTARLRNLSGRRKRISNEIDRILVRDITDYIQEIALKYEVYVAIGHLRGIRNVARKGNFRGRTYRGLIHRWSFARVRNLLMQKLKIVGFESKRLRAVPEQWTSIKCHKCGQKGLRPKQNLFICHTCGYRTNADLNGAINIGRRLIMLIPSLRDEKGLGMWLLPKEKLTPKARRSSHSKRKSSLPKRTPGSSKGKSVVDCDDQTILESLVSSEDPAMVKTVEKSTVIARTGTCIKSLQRTEAGSRQRDYISMRAGKAHANVDGSIHQQTGDGSREKGGTQKFLEGALTSIEWS